MMHGSIPLHDLNIIHEFMRVININVLLII